MKFIKNISKKREKKKKKINPPYLTSKPKTIFRVKSKKILVLHKKISLSSLLKFLSNLSKNFKATIQKNFLQLFLFVLLKFFNHHSKIFQKLNQEFRYKSLEIWNGAGYAKIYPIFAKRAYKMGFCVDFLQLFAKNGKWAMRIFKKDP